MKRIIAALLLSVGMVGCGSSTVSSDCMDVQAAIREHVERQNDLSQQIEEAGGMSSAPQDLKDAYSDNQDELLAAYDQSTQVCAPNS